MTTRPFHGLIRTSASFVALFALMACSSNAGQSGAPTTSGAGPSATTSGLEGTLWQLAGYVGPDGKEVQVVKGSTASATFNAGTVTGNAGCNDFHGSYTVDGDKLTIGPLATTMKACGPAETIVETAYLAAMGKVATYTATDETLQLKGADGKASLRFTATEPTTLTGTRWVATSLNNGNGGVTSIVAGTSLTAIFGAAGTVAGSGGCNDYNGPYTTTGTTIKVGPLAATRKLCTAPAGVDAQESQFLAALQKATVATITGSKLELRDDGGALQVAFQATLGG